MTSSNSAEERENACPVCGSDLAVESLASAADMPCPYCGHRLWFTWEDRGDSQVIKPTCEILTAEDFGRFIDKVSLTRRRRLVLDLSQVRFMPSAVLGKFITLKKKLAGVHGTLRIENLQPDLLQIFRITRLDQVFEMGL